MVCGVGINDLKWSGHSCHSDYIRRVYILWYNTINRCYSSKLAELAPQYLEVHMDSSWLYLSNFARDIKTLPGYEEWLNTSDKNEKTKFVLDRVVDGEDTKFYSKDTCRFIPKAEQGFTTMKRHPEVVVKCNGVGSVKFHTVDSDGNVKYYSSIKAFCEENNCDHSYVSKVLRGKSSSRKTYKGLTFILD